MKYKIILVLILVLLVGCDMLGGEGSGDRITAVDYRTGISGLEIEILEGLPPKEIYEGSNFKIGLRLRNKGAYNINRGELSIAGFDQKYVIVSERKVGLEPIEGKSRTNSEGDFYIKEFDGQTLESLEGAKEYAANYYVVAEYDYRSEMQTEVCVNTNLYSDLKLSEESCKPEQTQSFSGQGAPIVISKLEEIIMPEGTGAKVLFKLKIENKGGGELKGPVYMEEVKLGNSRLICEPRFFEVKRDRENVFVCTHHESSSASYVTPFYAAIHYSYETREKTGFKIKTILV